MKVVMIMTGLYLTVLAVFKVSASLNVIKSSFTCDWSVLDWTRMTSDSDALTLKGLLGTLTPPHVTASVCLTADVGVYEQE